MNLTIYPPSKNFSLESLRQVFPVQEAMGGQVESLGLM